MQKGGRAGRLRSFDEDIDRAGGSPRRTPGNETDPVPGTMTSDRILKTAVRSLFLLTSRGRALRQATAYAGKYAALGEGITDEVGRLGVEVPPMPGVDEDMRRWSFFMILQHNTIVNTSITASVCQLARGEPLHGAAAIDPKRDVMPSPSAGREQLEAFRRSVTAHTEAVGRLGRLRHTRTSRHPLFGDFDAHRWNCMFSFHLRVHYPQAVRVIRIAKGKSGP